MTAAVPDRSARCEGRLVNTAVLGLAPLICVAWGAGTQAAAVAQSFSSAPRVGGPGLAHCPFPL